MIPRQDRYPGIIMELKWKKDSSTGALEKLADEALVQMDEKRYDSEMKFGIAFSGKRVSVKIK